MITSLVARPFLLKGLLATGAVALLGMGLQTFRLANIKTELAELRQDMAEAEVAALAAKNRVEENQRNAINAAREQLRKDHEKDTAELETRLAELRNAPPKRVRIKFCPPASDLSGTSASTAGDPGARGGELSAEDRRAVERIREDFLRIGADANRVTRKLTASQGIIIADRMQSNTVTQPEN